jgi:hypothetical protein
MPQAIAANDMTLTEEGKVEQTWKDPEDNEEKS